MLGAEDALALERDINAIDEEIFQEVAADAPELAASSIADLDRAALLSKRLVRSQPLPCCVEIGGVRRYRGPHLFGRACNELLV